MQQLRFNTAELIFNLIYIIRSQDPSTLSKLPKFENTAIFLLLGLQSTRSSNKGDLKALGLGLGLRDSEVYVSSVSPSAERIARAILVRSDSLRHRAKVQNALSFRISLRWPIHINNPVDKTKLSTK